VPGCPEFPKESRGEGAAGRRLPNAATPRRRRSPASAFETAPAHSHSRARPPPTSSDLLRPPEPAEPFGNSGSADGHAHPGPVFARLRDGAVPGCPEFPKGIRDEGAQGERGQRCRTKGHRATGRRDGARGDRRPAAPGERRRGSGAGGGAPGPRVSGRRRPARRRLRLPRGPRPSCATRAPPRSSRPRALRREPCGCRRAAPGVRGGPA